jgi:hypothetical protein
MKTSHYSIINTKTFATVDLEPHEVAPLIAGAAEPVTALQAAARAGQFAPILPGDQDTVAVDLKPDGSATLIVYMDRTTITASNQAAN